MDRVDYWLGVGAQASDTVASFIKKARKAADGSTVETNSEATPAPAAEEATPAPAAEEATLAPAAEEATPAPAAEEATSEPETNKSGD